MPFTRLKTENIIAGFKKRIKCLGTPLIRLKITNSEMEYLNTNINTKSLPKHGRKITRVIPKTNSQRPEKFISSMWNKSQFYILHFEI